MAQRIGISLNREDVQRCRVLQKRLGLRNRSELFRELAKRFENMEKHKSELAQCLEGYVRVPESPGTTLHILAATLKSLPPEDWE